jgi:hypothetical protein
MGQDRRRGTYEERKALAVARIGEDRKRRLEREASPEGRAVRKKEFEAQMRLSRLMAMFAGTTVGLYHDRLR